jgi:lactate dehydrogenase-like 2-hydroxyacid dehydrogenase
MSPIATTRKPRVFARYPLDDIVEAHARQFFQLTTYDDPNAANWRQEAEAVMVRIESITEEDAKACGPQLKFVCKHGVGTDQIAVQALAARGIMTMNMAGVNVCSFFNGTSNTDSCRQNLLRS